MAPDQLNLAKSTPTGSEVIQKPVSNSQESTEVSSPSVVDTSSSIKHHCESYDKSCCNSEVDEATKSYPKSDFDTKLRGLTECIPSNEVLDNLPSSDKESHSHSEDSTALHQSVEAPLITQEFGRSGDEQGGPDREEMIAHAANSQQGSQVIPDEAGNLRILVRKTKPLLGIAIEGGANTRHPLPRIININENGAAYDAGGLQVGQLILEVDGHKVEGMHHQEVARLIAESFAQRDKPHIEFLVVEAKKSNLEPKPTALIFLEA